MSKIKKIQDTAANGTRANELCASLKKDADQFIRMATGRVL